MGFHRVVEGLFDLVYPVVQGFVLFSVEFRQPVPGDLHLPALIAEIVGRRHFVDPFEEGLRSGGILEGEVALQCLLVQFLVKMRMVQETLDLRAEHQGAFHPGIIQRFDAKEVTGAEELLLFLVPDDEGKHAPQLVQQLFAVFFIAVEEHFRVGGGLEHMTCLQKVLFDFPIIVDLPVEGEDFATVLVQNGLASAFQVDNGKPPKPQGDGTVHIIIRVVRATVTDGVRHRAEHTCILLSVAAVNKSNESAHGRYLPFSSLFREKISPFPETTRLIILPQNGGE